MATNLPTIIKYQVCRAPDSEAEGLRNEATSLGTIYIHTHPQGLRLRRANGASKILAHPSIHPFMASQLTMTSQLTSLVHIWSCKLQTAPANTIDRSVEGSLVASTFCIDRPVSAFFGKQTKGSFQISKALIFGNCFQRFWGNFPNLKTEIVLLKTMSQNVHLVTSH